MIIVIATVEIQESSREAFLDEFRKVVPDVLQEDGCLQYEPSIDVETNMEVQGETRPNTVVVVEKWESLEALEAHLVAPHMVAYRAKVKDLVNSVAIQVLEPATAG
jgi:quinol monooxygenase YgiN